MIVDSVKICSRLLRDQYHGKLKRPTDIHVADENSEKKIKTNRY